MCKIILLFSLLLAAPIAAVSQVITCETNHEGPGKIVPGSSAPIFELGKPFEHPVPLPSHILALLRADEANAGKFEASPSRGGLAQVRAEWFRATEIKLADGELPGLIVKAEELGVFWVFRQSPMGYQLVLTEHTQALQVLNTCTGGYRDLCSPQSSCGHNTFYLFQEGKYLRDTFCVEYFSR
jgi:hypothetical protein